MAVQDGSCLDNMTSLPGDMILGLKKIQNTPFRIGFSLEHSFIAFLDVICCLLTYFESLSGGLSLKQNVAMQTKKPEKKCEHRTLT